MSGSMRMKVGLDLTSLHNTKFDEQLAASYEGQAHFAGTGPTGARCRGCSHWGDGARARALTKPCLKFQSMTGKSKPVPGSALACRYFEKRKS